MKSQTLSKMNRIQIEKPCFVVVELTNCAAHGFSLPLYWPILGCGERESSLIEGVKVEGI